MRYVQIAVKMPQVEGVYDYHLPAELEDRVQPGSLVLAPFGQRIVQGVVLREVGMPQVVETKAVLSLLDPRPVLSKAQVRLAEIMSERNLAPLAACIDLMIPPGIGQNVDTVYQLSGEPIPVKLSGLQARLVGLLQERGELRSRQIAAEFRHQNWRPVVQALQRRGIILSRSTLNPPSARIKTARQLMIEPQIDWQSVQPAALGRQAAGERRLSALRFLSQEQEPVDPAWVYAETGANAADLRILEEKGYLRFVESEVTRDPLADKRVMADIPPELTQHQLNALHTFNAQPAMDSGGTPAVLHGITGSGKTEIYLRLASEAVSQGRQVLVMVPEISLTPQTVTRFMARFQGQVGIQHSRLSPGERFDTWRRMRSGEIRVLVGPRSALFMPFTSLGLIVIDEFHDESYYQDDLLPAYDALDTAMQYARLTGSKLLLGSATPDLVLYHRAQQQGWPVLTLPDRLVTRLASPQQAPADTRGVLSLPEVRIVDMRAELRAGNISIFSQALQDALRRTLNQHQQAILFLNRRGSSTYVFCRDCGTTLQCPNCDLPLTSHESNAGSLSCHTCGYNRLMPAKCPSCGSKRIKQYGTGTEKVEEEVLRLFPSARTLRWDASTTQARDAHDVILEHFKNHQADVLIGTQMLTKGLDLPLVTLVGIVLADVGLNLPDYRSAERTFQHLMQVAGRAGRSTLGGSVILQSFTPEHYAIQAAARHDFGSFYQTELGYRRMLQYPPYVNMVKLVYQHTNQEKAKASAMLMAERLHLWIREAGNRGLTVVGPNPPFYSRVNRLYRYQILLKGADPAGFLLDKPLAGWQIQVNPPSIL